MHRRLRTVPRGYVVHRAGGTWLVLDEGLRRDLVRLRLAEPAVRTSLFARAAPGGRGTTPIVPLSEDTQVLLRRYRHGGALGKLTGTLFLGPGRALRELEVTARAEAAGAPVPHALCVVLWPVLGPFWSALIGTRRECQAHDLLEALRACGDARERRHLLREVAEAIRRLHDAGVEHRDLQLRNVLITQGTPRRVVVVDLDGARFHPRGTLPTACRARNLGRMARSAVKAGLLPRPLGRRELAAFVGAYTAGNRALRAELRAHVRWERFKLRAHGLSYPLRRVAAPRPDSPATPVP
ncbi:MAG: lipopolysaccharide kinase InaA family protein [Myxococcota bacterium]